MEPESADSIRKRRAKMVRNNVSELLLAAAFIAAVMAGDALVNAERTFALTPILAVGLPMTVLAAWWAFYAWRILSLGELERDVAIKSLAISCAATIWLFTFWGLAVEFASAPTIPLMLVAPVAAVVYGAARLVFFFVYR